MHSTPSMTMRCLLAVNMVALAWLAVAPAVVGGENTGPDWPPVPCERDVDGRKIDLYRHGTRPEWNSPQAPQSPQKKSYPVYVVHPRIDRAGAPLYVVLHSAGHNAESCMKDGFERSADGTFNNHGLFHAPDEFYGLYQQADAWWGRDDKPTVEDGPVEKRVMDVVAWVIAKYKIDPNRVYLCGISMGGSGSLGVGMRHGDVFASEMVWVPAGTEHVARRLFFGKKAPDGLVIPDPPFLLNISAQNDGWSKTQDVLLKGIVEKKLAMVMGWGPIGHASRTKAYLDNCGAIMAFPWLEIRKNEAYPVFIGATSDQKPPWLNPQGADEKGQINAWFRWKSVQDEPTAFSMRLWLEEPPNIQSPYAIPKESTADVTFRRLQKFKVPAGKTYAWELVRESKTIAGGTVEPDDAGLLTIPKVTISPTPVEVRLTAKAK